MTDKRFEPAKKKKLYSQKKFEHLKPVEMLKNLNLKKGDIMIDVGAGNGFFSLPAAEIVGEKGKVYSVDVEIDMLLDLKHRAQKAGLTDRIEIVKSNVNSANLREPADFMLFAYLLHEVEAPEKFLRNYFKFLKKGSKVIFIEWDTKKREEGPPIAHRIESEALRLMLAKENLTKIKEKSIDYNSYLISAIKA